MWWNKFSLWTYFLIGLGIRSWIRQMWTEGWDHMVSTWWSQPHRDQELSQERESRQSTINYFPFDPKIVCVLSRGLRHCRYSCLCFSCWAPLQAWDLHWQAQSCPFVDSNYTVVTTRWVPYVCQQAGSRNCLAVISSNHLAVYHAGFPWPLY